MDSVQEYIAKAHEKRDLRFVKQYIDVVNEIADLNVKMNQYLKANDLEHAAMTANRSKRLNEERDALQFILFKAENPIRRLVGWG